MWRRRPARVHDIHARPHQRSRDRSVPHSWMRWVPLDPPVALLFHPSPLLPPSHSSPPSFLVSESSSRPPLSHTTQHPPPPGASRVSSAAVIVGALACVVATRCASLLPSHQHHSPMSGPRCAARQSCSLALRAVSQCLAPPQNVHQHAPPSHAPSLMRMMPTGKGGAIRCTTCQLACDVVGVCAFYARAPRFAISHANLRSGRDTL